MVANLFKQNLSSHTSLDTNLVNDALHEFYNHVQNIANVLMYPQSIS